MSIFWKNLLSIDRLYSYKRHKAGILTNVHVYIPWIVHHVSIFYLVMSVVQVFNKKYHINSAPTNSTSVDILTYPYVYVPWIVNHFSILYPVISVLQVFDSNQTEKLFYVHYRPRKKLSFKDFQDLFFANQ